MRKKRHNYTPEEKVSILRRHLVDHVPVSDLCDKHQLSSAFIFLYPLGPLLGPVKLSFDVKEVQSLFLTGIKRITADNGKNKKYCVVKTII